MNLVSSIKTFVEWSFMRAMKVFQIVEWSPMNEKLKLIVIDHHEKHKVEHRNLVSSLFTKNCLLNRNFRSTRDN